MVARQINERTLRGETVRYAKPQTAKEAAILDAATRLFGERGLEATRTADIAAAAGVTERTLFRYFPTKRHLYRRVMFPALAAAAVPRALMDAGELFGTEAESAAEWHRRVLSLRLDAAKKGAPQFRLLLAALMTDEALRRRVVKLWKENVLAPLAGTVRRYQRRGQFRHDLRPEQIARAVISLNLGYIIARALLAPDAPWDDEAEIDATVEMLLRGVGKG
ncbi:MAG TPA: TetR/AcrR family transcriptional regulator [Burkholderiales bacterium]|nr:TetR/AcrR family transcriptional regulator [Burkholderiales bacterium]